MVYVSNRYVTTYRATIVLTLVNKGAQLDEYVPPVTYI